jgi:hypothetical protein
MFGGEPVDGPPDISMFEHSNLFLNQLMDHGEGKIEATHRRLTARVAWHLQARGPVNGTRGEFLIGKATQRCSNWSAGRAVCGGRRHGEMKRLAAASAPRCGFVSAHSSNPSVSAFPNAAFPRRIIANAMPSVPIQA